MKQKKGFLLAEETLKIIIAVLCIGFLAYLLFSIYNNNNNTKNLDFAKSTLNSIFEAINGGRASVDIYNPSGWYLDVWPQTVKSGGLPILGIGAKTETGAMPLSCSNVGWKSCICICNQNTQDGCDNNGVCLNNTGNFDITGKSIELKNLPLTLNIDQKGKVISDGS